MILPALEKACKHRIFVLQIQVSFSSLVTQLCRCVSELCKHFFFLLVTYSLLVLCLHSTFRNTWVIQEGTSASYNCFYRKGWKTNLYRSWILRNSLCFCVDIILIYSLFSLSYCKTAFWMRIGHHWQAINELMSHSEMLPSLTFWTHLCIYVRYWCTELLKYLSYDFLWLVVWKEI